ncbi:MAG: GAF domain-containing protein [Nitrospinota bacterium]
MSPPPGQRLNHPDTLHRIVHESRRALGADRCALFLQGPGAESLEIEASIGLSQEYIDAVSRKWRDLPAARLMHEPQIFFARDAARDPALRALRSEIEAEGYRSLVLVPLCIEGKSIGWLAFFFDDFWENSPERESSLKTFADLAAVAISSDRLYEREREATRRLGRLQELALRVSSSLEFPEVLQAIAQATVELLEGCQSRIYLLEPETGRLICKASYGITSDVHNAPKRLRVGVGLGGKVARDGKPVISADIQKEPSWLTVSWARTLDLHSFVCVPLLSAGKVLGVINCHSQEVGQFTEADIKPLESLAGHAVVAIEKANHVESLKARIAEQEGLVSALGHIPSGLDVNNVIEAVLAESGRVMETDRCSVVLRDERTGEPRLFSSQGISAEFIERLSALPAPFPIGRAYLEDPKRVQPTVLPDVSRNSTFGPVHLREGHRSLAAFPLRMGEKNLGVLFYFWTAPQRLDKRRLRLGQAFADQVAISIENARLFAEAQGRATNLEVLDEIAKAINSTLEIDDLFRIAVEQVKRVLPCDRASLFTLDADKRAVAKVCIVDDSGVRKDRVTAPRDLAGTYYERILKTREPLYVPDTRRECHPRHRALATIGLRSIINVPILGEGQCVGFLNVGSEQENAFSHAHVDLLKSVAGHLAIAMKNAELYAQVRQTGERLENFVRGATDAIITIDLQGRIASWNPGAETLYGYAEKEVRGRKFLSIFPEAEAEYITFLTRFESGETCPRKETIRRRKDGTEVEVSITLSPIRDNTGRIVGASGIHREIGAQKRAEQALRKSEEKYRTLFEQARDAIEIVDETGRLVDCNQKACELSGYTREELLGKRLEDIVKAEYKEGLTERISRLLKGEVLAPYESVNLRKDGSPVALEVSASFTEMEGRKRMIFFLRDITERMRLEEQLRRTQKLEALGRLASGVAHDFNNTLAVILGRAELLKKLIADSATRRALEIIEKAALTGAQTVKRLQNFARKREDRPAGWVNLNNIIRDAAETARHEWKDEAQRDGHPAEVCIEARAKQAVIQGEDTELHEALINLIHNALDAMPDGGRVTLSTWNTEEGVVVCVSDTGKGMTPDERKRAFEPFFTTKGERGSGLGLSMVYGIVERYGGEILLESEPGKGTAVRLTFPVRAERPETPERADAPPAESRRILVIDDEKGIVDLFGEFLRMEGHEVETATDPIEGLNRFREKPFDLVFTDLGMPGMAGWDVAKAVKEANPAAAVVLVTGWGAEFDEGKLTRSGVDFVLEKPVKHSDILSAVAAALPQTTPSP